MKKALSISIVSICLCSLIITFSLKVEKDQNIRVSAQEIIRDDMTIESIMKDYKSLSGVDFEYQKVTLDRVYDKLNLDEFTNQKLLFYLTNYTPKSTYDVLGVTVFSFEDILQEIQEIYNYPKFFDMGFIPIAYYDGKCVSVDKETGKTFRINVYMIKEDNKIEYFSWDPGKDHQYLELTKENVAFVASEEYSMCDDIYEYFIEKIIDLESENK